MKQGDEKLFYSIAEVAHLLNLNERTVRRWLYSRKLSGHRLGRQWRIARKDLERFLTEHHHEACGRVF